MVDVERVRFQTIPPHTTPSRVVLRAEARHLPPGVNLHASSASVADAQSNFSSFRERLAEACRVRDLTHDKLCSSIRLGGSRAVDLDFPGLKALDIYGLVQMADRLDVSIDWLLGLTE